MTAKTPNISTILRPRSLCALEDSRVEPENDGLEEVPAFLSVLSPKDSRVKPKNDELEETPANDEVLSF